MERYVNQIVSRDLQDGEVLFNKRLTANRLLFVFTGALLIRIAKNNLELRVNKGHFILLSADVYCTATAVAASHILNMQAGSLSKMIIDDPEWNPECPAILPILPTLEHTLRQIEYYQKEVYYKLN